MSESQTTHDKLFKTTLQDIKSAREFLENFLPPEILSVIDLKKLRLDTTNYFTPDMREKYADVVLNTLFYRSKDTFILLLDHKTRIDRELIVQMLYYVLGILSHNISNKKPYSFVLPIVVYHGDRKSKPKPLYSHFKNLPPFLQKFVPALELIFINLGAIPNDKLLDLSDDTILKSTFLLLKNAEDANFIRKNFSEIVNFKENNPNYSDFVIKIALYLYYNSALESEEIDELFLEHDNKNIVMKAGVGVAAKQLIEKGITQGITQGEMKKTIAVVHKCWLRGYSIDKIADIAEISAEEVKKLIAQFQTEQS